MAGHAIDIQGLTHRYAADPVLRGVNLAVPNGAIYGLSLIHI